MTELKEKIRNLGRAILQEVDNVKGIEFTVFFNNGTRINYNSRNDEEEEK